MLSKFGLDPNAVLVDISEENNRNYWASKLGVSIERLKTAVRATHSLDFQQLKAYLQLAQHKRTYNYKTYVKN